MFPKLTCPEIYGSQFCRNACQDDTLDAPSSIISDSDDSLFGGGGGGADEDALINMLMQENVTAFSNENV